MKIKARACVKLNCSFSKKFSPEVGDVQIETDKEGTTTLKRADFKCMFKGNCGSTSLRPSVYSFDALLRVLYSVLLTKNSGLLLHASGIALKKKGILFLGPSGSGKTTISRIAKETTTILNDEIIACKISSKGRIAIYGTPFWGEMRTGPAYSNAYALKSLYFLSKKKKTYRSEESLKSAMQKLLRCCCIFSIDEKEVEKILNTCTAILNNTPSYTLHFQQDNSFLKII